MDTGYEEMKRYEEGLSRLQKYINAALADRVWLNQGDLDTGIRNDRDMKALTVEMVKFSPENGTDDGAIGGGG